MPHCEFNTFNDIARSLSKYVFYEVLAAELGTVELGAIQNAPEIFSWNAKLINNMSRQNQGKTQNEGQHCKTKLGTQGKTQGKPNWIKVGTLTVIVLQARSDVRR